MPRPPKAINRHHLRVQDPALLASVVSQMAWAARVLAEEERAAHGVGKRRGPRGDGVRDLAWLVDVPRSVLSDWIGGRVLGVSRAHFTSLSHWCSDQLSGSDGVAEGWLTDLLLALAPTDGGDHWHSPTTSGISRKYRTHRPPVTLQELLGDRYNAVSKHIRAGTLSAISREVWLAWPVERPVFVNRSLERALKTELMAGQFYEAGLAVGIEGPDAWESEDGPRFVVWFSSTAYGRDERQWRRWIKGPK